jgi:hypothetical protein
MLTRFLGWSLLASVACVASLSAADLVTTAPVTQGSGKKVAVDGSGNRYIIGSFSGSVDFNPVAGTDIKTSGGFNDVFITRFNADGSYGWTQTFGGTSTESPDAIILNPAGSILYASLFTFSTSAGFGGSGSIIPPGSGDSVILALNTIDGTPVTAFSADGVQVFGGTGSDGIASLALSGNTLLCGGYIGSTNATLGGSGSFTCDTGTDAMILAVNATDGSLVTTFNTTGMVRFGANSASGASGKAVAVSATNVCLAGSFSGLNFGFGGTGGVGSAAASSDCFVISVNITTGAVDTAFSGDGIQTFGGSSSECPLGIAVDSGTVYMTGYMDSTDAGVGGAGSISRVGSSFDTFVLALNTSDGAARTTFSSDGAQFFGGAGSSQGNDIIVFNSTVYVAGDFTFTTGGIGSPTGAAATVGSNDAFIIALDATTGAAQTAFSTDGIQAFAGTAGDFAYGLAAGSNAVFVTGSFSSTAAQLGGTGSTYDSTGAGGFLLLLDKTTGALTTYSAAAITASALPNPAQTGESVTFTAVGSGPFTWNFGDGTAAVVGNPVTHTFSPTVDTTYSVTVSGGGSATVSIEIVVPNTGATGITNVSNGVTVSNPLVDLTSSVTSSNGGNIELTLDATSVPRVDLSVLTDFDDIPGRAATNINGAKAVHKFTTKGIYIATTRAVDGSTEKGKVRKTLNIDARETGESGALALPSSTAIASVSLKGKFLYSKTAADLVTFTGEITLPAGLDIGRADGNSVSIAVGNVVDTVTVDAKGRAGASSLGLIAKLKVKYPRLAKGATTTVGGEKAKVTAQLKAEDLDLKGFDTEGITNALATDETGLKVVPRSIQVAVLLAGVAYETLAPVDYKLTTKQDSGQINSRR